MEDIARAAGVTRPVPYNHFGTKEGVYIACVLRATIVYNAELAAQIDPDAHPQDQLRQGAEVFFGLLERDRGRWALIFASSSVLPPEFARELGQVRFDTIATIELLLRRASPSADPKRMAAAAHAVSGVSERLGHWWLSEPSMTRDEVIDHYTALLWPGLEPYTD